MQTVMETECLMVQRKTDGTDGLDTCDYVVSSQTVATSAAWNAADCDSDGVTNGDEVTDGNGPIECRQ